SSVPLQLVNRSELNITNDSSDEVYTNYANQISRLTEKYFAKDDLENILSLIENGTVYEIENVRLKAALLSTELKSVEIPAVMETFHRYLIAVYALLPEILSVPSS